MRILVACEESQSVTIALREKGHEAYSCDILPCSGGREEYHIRQDVLPILDGFCEFRTEDGLKHKINSAWDMIIAFPPCTYMTRASAVRMMPGGVLNLDRFNKAMEAKKFFLRIFESNCQHIAIENPTPLKLVGLPPCNQVIQPWQFGHPYTKRTCLWLKGLPDLKPTNIITENIIPWVNGGSLNKDGTHKSREKIGIKSTQKERSKTFPGIAKAMADQWG